MGKALGIVVVVIGVPLGTAVGTVAFSAGASEANAVSIGILAGALIVISGNMAIRKLIKKTKIQRPS
ncbi:hypothetical protein [Cohnella luojiensis]|uniref:Uncharacterized protein n=1 Tax=Cohnella luojiensis TaxID=652876 RepID=A0A4Y8LWU9_9BACL|nr:hypothetical protein [Cohnella luojiensis]TFE25525.1 hypothetical protein E2980_13095 [Cohnella luojiensis]